MLMSKFSEVKSPALRAWNQLQHARNLESARGAAASEVYFGELSEPEKQNVLLVAARITIKGEDFVRAEVNREVSK